uniref:Uncharacterized protein n=1 Tax=uncultured bacterium BAC AB649/1850 TaxID=1037453 RepID=F6K0Z1_9BACT|nr:hypothetical protein [uncultured bacterium BAC AB649/1850]
MTTTADHEAAARRAARAQARLSRRPSRLGEVGGRTETPDRTYDPKAGFPGLLDHVRRTAAAQPPHTAALTLLTLDGHVPADVQLRALRLDDEAAMAAVFGLSWRADEPDPPVGETAFVGEIGLTTSGRVVLRVPSAPPLAGDVDLVGPAIRVPWPAAAIESYQKHLEVLRVRTAESVEDARTWLAEVGETGREEMLDLLIEAALRTAPFVLYQGDRLYTNFRERNTLTGKTLWPGHPDCALSALKGVPLALWSDNDALLVVCLTLLVRSAGFGRIEEANSTQLTPDHIAELLERTRRRYDTVPGGARVAPAPTARVADLAKLADDLKRRRGQLDADAGVYREIHGPLMHKIEKIAGPWSPAAEEREQALCARLRERLPIDGACLADLGAAVAAEPAWLSAPHGAFGTGLESLVYETVAAATSVFAADFAMSRGLRSLPTLIRALRSGDWSRITEWELPEFFCCVVPDPDATRHFGRSVERLADAAWSMSARMQYNSWHFIAGNLPRTPDVVARDHFVPPVVPDIAYYSDQHHHGHLAARVRFSIRSPQAVTILGRRFGGFVDLRLLRCDGEPFAEVDLQAAHRLSGFVATATSAAAALVAEGQDVAVTAFDTSWHMATIAAAAAGLTR